MDAQEITTLKNRVASLEARGTKEFLADIATRDKLVRDVTPVVGTFDHAEMSAADVAKYALDKLEIKAEAGQEKAVLAGYLAGRNASAGAAFALDSKLKPEGLLNKRLNGSTAA